MPFNSPAKESMQSLLLPASQDDHDNTLVPDADNHFVHGILKSLSREDLLSDPERLSQLKNDLNTPLDDEGGATLLHLAALQGNFVVMEQLLKNGANLESKNNSQKTPLYCVTQKAINILDSIVLNDLALNLAHQYLTEGSDSCCVLASDMSYDLPIEYGHTLEYIEEFAGDPNFRASTLRNKGLKHASEDYDSACKETDLKPLRFCIFLLCKHGAPDEKFENIKQDYALYSGLLDAASKGYRERVKQKDFCTGILEEKAGFPTDIANLTAQFLFSPKVISSDATDQNSESRSRCIIL